MIRKASFEDTEAVYEIVNEAYKGGTGKLHGRCQRYNFSVHSDKMKEEMKHMFVYVEDNEIAGCVKAEFSFGKVLVGPLAVEKQYRRRGVCSKMLTFVEALAPAVELLTSSSRPELVALYTQRGYREIGRLPLKQWCLTVGLNIGDFERHDFDVVFFRKTRYVFEDLSVFNFEE